MDPMAEEVLFKNRRADRPATLDEYRQSGGYEALIEAVKQRTPDEVRQLVLDSGLRGGAAPASPPAASGVSSLPLPAFRVT